MKIRYLAVAVAVAVGTEMLLRSWMGPGALPLAVGPGLLASFALKRRPSTPREAAYVVLMALAAAAGTGLGPVAHRDGVALTMPRRGRRPG
jgi:uncharacterized membrane protein